MSKAKEIEIREATKRSIEITALADPKMSKTEKLLMIYRMFPDSNSWVHMWGKDQKLLFGFTVSEWTDNRKYLIAQGRLEKFTQTKSYGGRVGYRVVSQPLSQPLLDLLTEVARNKKEPDGKKLVKYVNPLPEKVYTGTKESTLACIPARTWVEIDPVWARRMPMLTDLEDPAVQEFWSTGLQRKLRSGTPDGMKTKPLTAAELSQALRGLSKGLASLREDPQTLGYAMVAAEKYIGKEPRWTVSAEEMNSWPHTEKRDLRAYLDDPSILLVSMGRTLNQNRIVLDSVAEDDDDGGVTEE